MFLRKEKESRVKHKSAFEQLRPVIAPVKQNVLFTRPTNSGQCPLRLQALETEQYDIFSKPSYNDKQFNLRFRSTQPLRSKYAIIIFMYGNHPSPSTATCRPKKHNERTLLSSDYSQLLSRPGYYLRTSLRLLDTVLTCMKRFVLILSQKKIYFA